jgi:hypothetical protein
MASPYFSEAIAAALKGEAVGLAILGDFDFADGSMRLWLGDGVLDAGGHQWSGIGQWGGISSITSGAGDAAVPVTFTLSGVDEDIALKVSAGPSVRGRKVTISLQFFDGATMAPLDAPVLFWTGRMDLVSTEFDATSSVVTVTAEGGFVKRSKARAGLLTDRDQQARFPGDLGLEFVPSVINKQVKWPNL